MHIAGASAISFDWCADGLVCWLVHAVIGAMVTLAAAVLIQLQTRLIFDGNGY